MAVLDIRGICYANTIFLARKANIRSMDPDAMITITTAVATTAITERLTKTGFSLTLVIRNWHKRFNLNQKIYF